MGSFAPPTAGGERAAPLSSRPPVAETTYRYSTAPPPQEPAPEPKQEKPTVNVLRSAPGWIPDQTLILPLHKDLREQLYACALDHCFTVVITGSPDTALIKSRVAGGLALSLADTGHPRILLMEANFHHPAVHRLMHVDVPVPAGFSQQLHSRIHAEGDKPWNVIGCSETLHVLAEGMMRSPGMILSKQFERSLRDLQKYYDLIVIDGPDTSFEFDCRALDSLADGVALVCTNPESPEVQQDQALFTNKRFSTVISVVP
jgi:Mrp family chromosome partitioning ATPase